MGFTDAVDKFYDMLTVGQVYTVSKATLKAANKARRRQAPRASRHAPAFETRTPWLPRCAGAGTDRAARTAEVLAAQVRV